MIISYNVLITVIQAAIWKKKSKLFEIETQSVQAVNLSDTYLLYYFVNMHASEYEEKQQMQSYFDVLCRLRQLSVV